MRPSIQDNIITLQGAFVEAMSDEELFAFCQANADLYIERNADQTLFLMPPPTALDSGSLDSEVNCQVRVWNKRTQLGHVLSSSTGFILPNGAMRSPNTAWVANAVWEKLTFAERQRFGRFCPEFVVEVKSPSDSLPTLQLKMEEWRANGAQLGWLLVPETETIYVYRAGAEGCETVLGFDTDLPADPVLPGFALDLRELGALLR